MDKGMNIIGARWSRVVNWHRFQCPCGKKFWRRADRRKIVCPSCLLEEDAFDIRERFIYYKKKKVRRVRNKKKKSSG